MASCPKSLTLRSSVCFDFSLSLGYDIIVFLSHKVYLSIQPLQLCTVIHTSMIIIKNRIFVFFLYEIVCVAYSPFLFSITVTTCLHPLIRLFPASRSHHRCSHLYCQEESKMKHRNYRNEVNNEDKDCTNEMEGLKGNIGR